MSQKFKNPIININKEVFAHEQKVKGIYFAIVLMWTMILTVPLFWLADFLFNRSEWLDLMLIRLIVAVISYIIYTLAPKFNWNFIFMLQLFVGINMLMHTVIACIVPVQSQLPYFFILSIVILLINTIIFWPPIYSLLVCIFSYILIVWLFSFNTSLEKYNILLSHGGAVYFVVSAFSCLIAYNRFYILRRDIAHDIVLDEANTRLIEQNEKINDQRYVIEDANRKLKTLNDYRHNTMNIMLNDFRNFTGSIQMSLDLLKNKSENLSVEQKEILNYISTGNDKLSYLSEKLAASADRDEAKVEFNYEYFDINPELERAVMNMADAAQLKNINLQLHLSASVIMVYLDKLFLSQVMFKLLTNAVKYAQSGSIVTIHSHLQTNDKCLIEVINFGKEVGSEKLNDLFNKLKPYKSLRESITSDADLGFSIAKKLTESMNGTLTYLSDEKKGNYYKIEFNSTH
jgi:signal transduction histidine kinase